MKTAWYSRPLALCRVISVTFASPLLEVVLVGVERDRLQELLERGQLGVALERAVGVELGGDADQLLEVLDPPLGLDRPLGPQRVEVAAALQQRPQQLGDRAVLELGLELLDQLGEAADRLDRGGARGRAPTRARSATSQIVCAGGVGVGAQPPLAGVADPAARAS